jgi:S-formylglutathione hydrolase FrmB
MLRRACWALVVLLTVAIGLTPATGMRPCTWTSINSINKKLRGQLVDFTHNHFHDRRIWSNALCQKRDLYVYLPPCYDPCRQYPAMIYLHGIAQDEASFLGIVEMIDQAMACGQMPHMIIAVPDGTTMGHPAVFNAGSFYVNSRAGRFEDYVIQDVWGFVTANFPVRPEPEQHVLCGASMGGFGAFNLGIKYRDQFRIVAGIFPPLHVRYLDCHGNYFADYDPNCLGIRDRLAPFQAVGRFYGVIVIREHVLSQPLYGSFNKQAIQHIAKENPYEMIDTCNLQPGQLQMFAGYGKNDEFNIDAQVEAFADKARCKGLDFTCFCDPCGRHDTATGVRIFPHFCEWLTPRLANPLAPPTK